MAESEILKEYKSELIKLIEKSQDAFEKQLSYISAGSLGISMAFIKNVVGDISSTHSKWVLIVGWILLGVTLLLNLLSHIVAFSNHSKTLDEINLGSYSQIKAIKRNNRLKVLNLWSIISLIAGILLVIIFVALNI